MTILFWILVALICYTYLGYTLVLTVSNLFIKKKQIPKDNSAYPEITHVVAAYNETEIIPDKIRNTSALDYPSNKITNLWVTDGSNDGSFELLTQSTDYTVLHLPERLGKTHAINRALQQVKTPITIFSDANTLLSKTALKELVRPFNNTRVGCVAGEKHVVSKRRDVATASGEGHYWSYESFLKKQESDFGSTMGAVGELYAIRTHLFTPPNSNTILDDFVVSVNIILKGYKIHYAPKAIAKEQSSSSIKEEMKRKIRIAAGGFQVLFERPELLNFFKHPRFTFQYISHKVLRWFVAPLSLPALFFANMSIIAQHPVYNVYLVTWAIQFGFYSFAFLGYLLKNTPIRLKILFLPYYFVLANYAQIKGMFRYSEGSQNVAWEKATRKKG